MKNIFTELVLAHYHLVTVVHGFPLSEHSGLVSLFSQFMAGQGRGGGSEPVFIKAGCDNSNIC